MSFCNLSNVFKSFDAENHNNSMERLGLARMIIKFIETIHKTNTNLQKYTYMKYMLLQAHLQPLADQAKNYHKMKYNNNKGKKKRKKRQH